MPGLKKLCKVLQHNSKGVGLVEALIAVAILGLVAVVYLSGLFTAFKSDIVASEQTTAESLTRSELEYIRNCDYADLSYGFSYEIPGNPPSWDATHNTLDSHYANYSVDVTGEPIDADRNPLPAGEDEGLQRITAQIYHQGELVLTSSTYKVSR
jgi:Tfp pilus assembly protein PilE